MWHDCREGLDWLVSEAPKYGVKLMLTLTNYQVNLFVDRNAVLQFGQSVLHSHRVVFPRYRVAAYSICVH